MLKIKDKDTRTTTINMFYFGHNLHFFGISIVDSEYVYGG